MATTGRIEQAVETAKEATAEAAGGPARLRVILLLGAVLGLDAADKAAISAIAGSLEQAFGISNIDIGILVAAVSFIGAVFTVPAGVLADLVSRKRVLLASIALWTIAEVVSGTATSFVYLLLVRLFLGAVTAVAAPAIATLVGDFFPPQARGRAYGVILGGELVGVAVGFLFSAEISVALDWRWSLYLMGILGVSVFAVLWFFLVEPARGGQSWIRFGQEEMPNEAREQEQHAPQQQARAKGKGQRSDHATEDGEGAEPEALARHYHVPPRRELVLRQDPTHWSLWRVMSYLLHIPTYLLLIVASTLGYYFFAGVRAFAMLYLTQHFSEPRSVAVWIAAIIGFGALVGVLLGGRISQWWLNRGHIDSRIVVPGVALLVAVILLAPGIWVPDIYLGTALLALGFAALGAANPPIDAARLDVVHSALWGRGEAGRTSLRSLFEGGAPILFGAISEWFGGGGAGLQWTFLIMLFPVLIAASLAIPARLTYQRDVATAAASVQQTREQRG